MAQYLAFDPHVEVNNQTVRSVVEALDTGKEFRAEVLHKHGIQLQDEAWWPQQSWLDAFREIAEEVGEKTLFMIGKAIPEHAQFPPEINNLEAALHSIDVAYHMNHRGGEIGHYSVLGFDGKNRAATMVCTNPYPSEFDRGIITTILRRFRPSDSLAQNVMLDLSQPTRKDGADSCTYQISW